MCHPLITAFQVLEKFCASVGKRSPTLGFRNTPPAISTSVTRTAAHVLSFVSFKHFGLFARMLGMHSFNT